MPTGTAPDLRRRIAALRAEFERLQTAGALERERARTEAARSRAFRRRRWTVRYEQILVRKTEELSDISFD